MRLDVPRPRLLGITWTLRGVGVAALMCMLGGGVGVLIGERLITVVCGMVLMVVLLSGYLAWMAHITWRKNPRAFVVTDTALVIEGPDPVELPLSKITACGTIDQKGFPMFLQIHFDGKAFQYTVMYIPPKDVRALVDAIRSRL